MKKMPAVLLAAALSLQVFGETEFKFECDHPDMLYKCGETAVYTVTATEKGGAAPTGGVVKAVLDNFGPKKVQTAEWDLSATNVFVVSGTLDEPGFLRLTVGPGGKGRVWSVGFEPERIKKGSPSPADFDAFWAEARAKLAREVPLDAKMDRVAERSTDKFDFYRVSFATFGRRVYGYMSVPTDKSKAPFAVRIGVNAAGFGDWTNNMDGSDGCIRAQFSVYPFEPDWKWKETNLKEKYDALGEFSRKKYNASGYPTGGISVSREEYFFYPVILGIDRAVSWIAERDDVDRKRFFYEGTSQGGGFGLYLCGLNHVFTRAALYVPAITDTMGYLKGRSSGWPRLVENNSKTPGAKAAAEKWAPYFDGANFASRVVCPIRVAVGFSDNTCPPCAVYATYNELGSSDKGIVHGFGMGHGCFPKFYKELGAWIHSPVR